MSQEPEADPSGDAVLAEYGIETDWSSDIRIRVKPFAWQKRRSSTAPPRPVVVKPRVFRHRDGRCWTIAGTGRELAITIVFDDGETILRKRPTADVRADMERLIAEQLADGFVEDLA